MSIKRIGKEPYSYIVEEMFTGKNERKTYIYANEYNYDQKGRVESTVEQNACKLKEDKRMSTKDPEMTTHEEAQFDAEVEKKSKELKKNIMAESSFLTHLCVIDTETYKESIYKREDLHELASVQYDNNKIPYHFGAAEEKEYQFNKFVYTNSDNKNLSMATHRIERAKGE